MAVKQKQELDSKVVTVRPHAPVRDAADSMKQHDVGCVVVVDEENRPIGLMTDRDIVVKVLDDVANLDAVNVADFMSKDPVTIREGSNIMDLFEVMSYHGVRRLPVVNEEGTVINLVSFDDLIRTLANELDGLVDVLASESTRKNIREFL